MKKFLTTKQVAMRFQVTPQTVRNWIKKGVIDAVQLCPRGRILFDAKHIDDVSSKLIGHGY